MAARQHARVEGSYRWEDQSRGQARAPKPLCLACKDTRDNEDVVKLWTQVSLLIGQTVHL
jgi:hypothetical protein